MNRILTLAAICALLAISCDKTIQPDNSNKQPSEAASTTNQQVTAQQILDSFLNAELPIYNVITYTEETDPNKQLGRPGGYLEKVVWADKRAEQMKGLPPVGGTIETFKTIEDLERRKHYLETGMPIGPPLIEYRYIFKNAIIRIRQDLTPKQAAEYERVLQNL